MQEIFSDAEKEDVVVSIHPQAIRKSQGPLQRP